MLHAMDVAKIYWHKHSHPLLEDRNIITQAFDIINKHEIKKESKALFITQSKLHSLQSNTILACGTIA